MDEVESIVERDYSNSIKAELLATEQHSPGRKVLSDERSLGSVIKLLTVNEELYTDEHNNFVKKIPNHIRAI
eukprot:3588864-Ditylum_brightwellii.AAC.1